MSKSIILKNNTYIDSAGITHNRAPLKDILNANVEVIYQKAFIGGETDTFYIPTDNAMYLVIGQLRSDSCIFDVVYGKCVTSSRLSTTNNITITYTNTTGKVDIKFNFTGRAVIIKIPMFY